MGMHIVVGLGNPGPKYAGHRHNVGFMVVDALRERWHAATYRDKFKALQVKGTHGGVEALLLKPQTFMNVSGESVQPAMRFFKVPLERVLVIHDELDLDFGVVRLKVGGGTAGHNGLKSIVRHGGGNGFVRLRFGIGRPRGGRTEGHVLSDFSSAEKAEVGGWIDHACEMVEAALVDGPVAAMNRYHGG